MPPKRNLTIHELINAPVDKHILTKFPSRSDIPEYRFPVHRLSYSVPNQPDFYSDHTFLVETFKKSAWEGSVFVIDTCFSSGEHLPDEVWDALLQHTVVITPHVWKEMSAWRNNPFRNEKFRDAVLAARENENPSIVFLDPGRLDEYLQYTLRYYTNILGLRKYVGINVRDTIRKRTGVVPPDEKVIQICQSQFGERGTRLALKGLAKQPADVLADAEEEVVVAATMISILSGRETCVLTRDNDTMEQFRKLTYLLDTHYHGYLLAEAYKTDPKSFSYCSWPPNIQGEFKADRRDKLVEIVCDPFQSHPGNHLIELPEQWRTLVEPEEYRIAPVHCLLLGGAVPNGKASWLSFALETEMSSLLTAKGKSRGMNTNVLDGMNCHLCINPRLQDVFGGHAGILRDRWIESDDQTTRLAIADLELAVRNEERTAHLVPSNETDFNIVDSRRTRSR